MVTVCPVVADGVQRVVLWCRASVVELPLTWSRRCAALSVVIASGDDIAAALKRSVAIAETAEVRVAGEGGAGVAVDGDERGSQVPRALIVRGLSNRLFYPP